MSSYKYPCEAFTDMDRNLLHIDIDGNPTSALVDTGATVSVISRRFCRQLRKVVTPSFGCVLQGAGRSLLNPVGTCTARVTIRETTFPVIFTVLEHCIHDVILGFDVLQQIFAEVNCGTGRFAFVPPSFFNAVGEGATNPVKLFADEQMCLRPRTAVWVTASIGDASVDSEGCVEFSRRLPYARARFSFLPGIHPSWQDCSLDNKCYRRVQIDSFGYLSRTHVGNSSSSGFGIQHG